MAATMTVDAVSDLDLAREGMYRFLAAALGDPSSGRAILLYDPAAVALIKDSARLLQEDAETRQAGQDHNLSELLADLLANRPAATELGDEFVRVFGLVAAKDCPPYETEFCQNAETFYRSQQMADIAGFYLAFGLQPPAQPPERADNLALELDFLATLLMKRRLALLEVTDEAAARDQAEVCATAFLKFFTDHLSWWATAFSRLLAVRQPTGVFGAAARLLGGFVEFEGRRLGVPTRPQVLGPNIAIEAPEECEGCSALKDL